MRWRIREARVGDLHAMVMAILAMREETLWKDVSFTPNYDHIQDWLIQAWSQPQSHCWIAEENDAVVGLCGVELTTQRFIPDVPYLQEWALWVRPPYRRTSLPRYLWKEACEWGARQGAQGAVRGVPLPKGERMTFQYWGQMPCLTI